MSIGGYKQSEGHSETLILLCPICASDAGETLGVTGPVDGSLAATVVLQCADCSTVYLSPLPRVTDAVSNNSRSWDRICDRRIQRLKQSASADTSYLISDSTGAALRVPDSSAGRYRQVLLPRTLEFCADPISLTQRAAELLEDNGCLEIVVANADSCCFRWFGGRHWCGFVYPHTRQQLAARSVEILARNANLRIDRCRTKMAPASWLLSVRNWLQDWGAGTMLVSVLTGPWVLPWLVASLAEWFANLRDRGSILLVTMRKEGK